MGAFFFSIAVTAVLAIAAKVWLGGADLRRWDEMREWAADAGWQVRSSEDDARWPLPPSTYGSQLIAVDGRRDGYDVAHDHLTASEQDWVSPAEMDGFVDATLSVARAVEAR